MGDKRRHPRAAARGIAAYVWLNERLTSAIVENISPGGLFFRTPRPPERGTAVRVRLVQPGLKHAVELTGSVVSSISAKDALGVGQVPGSGVRFNKVPAEERERFDVLLAALGLPPVSAEQIAPQVVTARPAPDPSPPSPPPAPPPAPAARAPTRSSSSAGFVDYNVHEAELKLEPLPVQPRPPLHAGRVAGAPTTGVHLPGRTPVARAAIPVELPEPIELQVELKPPSRRRSDESDRLMVHVQGLMKQVTELEQQLLQRDLQIDLLQQEVVQLRQELAARQGRPRG